MKAKILKNERYSTGLNLSLLIFDEPEVLNGLAKMSGEVNVTIKEFRPKRSKDANDYAWALWEEMAQKLGTTKEEVYRKMLQRYGQSVIVTVKDGVDVGQLFKYYERFNDGLHNGVKFVAYKVFIGSSQYDWKQMSVLLDGTIQEAKTLGIQTDSTKFRYLAGTPTTNK